VAPRALVTILRVCLAQIIEGARWKEKKLPPKRRKGEEMEQKQKPPGRMADQKALGAGNSKTLKSARSWTHEEGKK